MAIKNLIILLAVLLALPAVSADIGVKVNGIEPGAVPLYAELGDSLDIQVALKSPVDVQDIRVKAWIDGYEYSLIEDSSDMIDLEADVLKKISLHLDVPEDMDLSDNHYTLVVEASGKSYYETEKFELYIKEPRHRVVIADVLAVPIRELRPGSLLMLKVRVKNEGYKAEKDVIVEASIPELGVSAREWIDNLSPRGEDDDAGTVALYLRVPSDAESGEYAVNVRVRYNNMHNEDAETRLFRIKDSASKSEDSVITSLLVPEKNLKVGERAASAIEVANVGKEKKTYFLDAYGDVEISGPVTLDEDEAGELYVYFTPKTPGKHVVEITVKTRDAKVASYRVEFAVSENMQEQWMWLGVLVLILAAIAVVMLAKHIDAKEYPKI